MKRVSLATLVLIIGAAACQDVITSPQPGAAGDALYGRFSNPPPPPIDTGAQVTLTGQPTFSIQQSSPFQPNYTIMHSSPLQPAFAVGVGSFVIPVTYMFNPPGNSGHLHFSDDPENSVDADANGMVKLSNGVFTGKGTVEIVTEDGLLVIHLESVNQNSSFAACGPPSEAIVPAADPRPEEGCFIVFYDKVTLNGVDIGGAVMTPEEVIIPD